MARERSHRQPAAYGLRQQAVKIVDVLPVDNPRQRPDVFANDGGNVILRPFAMIRSETTQQGFREAAEAEELIERVLG